MMEAKFDLQRFANDPTIADKMLNEIQSLADEIKTTTENPVKARNAVGIVTLAAALAGLVNAGKPDSDESTNWVDSITELAKGLMTTASLDSDTNSIKELANKLTKLANSSKEDPNPPGKPAAADAAFYTAESIASKFQSTINHKNLAAITNVANEFIPIAAPDITVDAMAEALAKLADPAAKDGGNSADALAEIAKLIGDSILEIGCAIFNEIKKLLHEIETTRSFWVKIRNVLEIIALVAALAKLKTLPIL